MRRVATLMSWRSSGSSPWRVPGSWSSMRSRWKRSVLKAASAIVSVARMPGRACRLARAAGLPAGAGCVAGAAAAPAAGVLAAPAGLVLAAATTAAIGLGGVLRSRFALARDFLAARVMAAAPPAAAPPAADAACAEPSRGARDEAPGEDGQALVAEPVEPVAHGARSHVGAGGGVALQGALVQGEQHARAATHGVGAPRDAGQEALLVAGEQAGRPRARSASAAMARSNFDSGCGSRANSPCNEAAICARSASVPSPLSSASTSCCGVRGPSGVDDRQSVERKLGDGAAVPGQVRMTRL